MKRITLLLAALLLSGCYSYQVVPTDALRPGTQVRAHITGEEVDRIGSIVGFETRDVEGRVDRTGTDGLMLVVPAQTASTGSEVRRFYQRVDLPWNSIMEVQERRLNKTKTYALVAAAVAGVGVLTAWTFGALGEGSGKGTKGGTNAVAVPPLLLRLAH